jgi:hypothetical protein
VDIAENGLVEPFTGLRRPGAGTMFPTPVCPDQVALIAPALLSVLAAFMVGCAREVRRPGGGAAVVAVSGYERADGTKVRPHSRWAPGARGEMFKAALFALAVLAIGGGAGTAATSGGDGSGELPKPGSTVVYPVVFPDWDQPAPRPTPTVSYPIPWDRSR